jgi:hypothetical protein
MRGIHQFAVSLSVFTFGLFAGCMSLLHEIKPSQELVVPDCNPLRVDIAQMERLTPP